MNDLIEHLRALGAGLAYPANDQAGLCTEIENKFGYVALVQCRIIWHGWPEFSGLQTFPVPGGEISASLAYMEAQGRHPSHMWRVGSYAAARRRLCLWLARELEKEGYETRND